MLVNANSLLPYFFCGITSFEASPFSVKILIRRGFKAVFQNRNISDTARNAVFEDHSSTSISVSVDRTLSILLRL
jgi:hypothetical protein